MRFGPVPARRQLGAARIVRLSSPAASPTGPSLRDVGAVAQRTVGGSWAPATYPLVAMASASAMSCRPGRVHGQRGNRPAPSSVGALPGHATGQVHHRGQQATHGPARLPTRIQPRGSVGSGQRRHGGAISGRRAVALWTATRPDSCVPTASRDVHFNGAARTRPIRLPGAFGWGQGVAAPGDQLLGVPLHTASGDSTQRPEPLCRPRPGCVRLLSRCGAGCATASEDHLGFLDDAHVGAGGEAGRRR